MANNKRTLIDNWVEERQCEDIDRENRTTDGGLKIEVMRSGHKGILSTGCACEYTTSIQSSFPLPTLNSDVLLSVNKAGERQKLVTERLYDMVTTEVNAELNKDTALVDYTTTTHSDYYTEETTSAVSPVQVYSLDDHPTSYWSQNKAKVTGITGENDPVCLFKRNSTFSCPIEHTLDQQ